MQEERKNSNLRQVEEKELIHKCNYLQFIIYLRKTKR